MAGALERRTSSVERRAPRSRPLATASSISARATPAAPRLGGGADVEDVDLVVDQPEDDVAEDPPARSAPGATAASRLDQAWASSARSSASDQG